MSGGFSGQTYFFDFLKNLAPPRDRSHAQIRLEGALQNAVMNAEFSSFKNPIKTPRARADTAYK
jgi:hypothetical protein